MLKKFIFKVYFVFLLVYAARYIYLFKCDKNKYLYRKQESEKRSPFDDEGLCLSVVLYIATDVCITPFFSACNLMNGILNYLDGNAFTR